VIMDINPKPWERQPYETPAMFGYFLFYLEQDSPRSLITAFRSWRAKRGTNGALAKRPPGSWRNIAAGKTRQGQPIEGAMTWEERALAWDDNLIDLERQKWVERRLELKEKEWEVSQKLLEKAEQMLMFPVMETRSADGVTVIYPAGWQFRDVPAVAQAASKLARLAAEMATENIAVDWREEARKAGISNPDAIFRETVHKFEREMAGGNDEGGLPDSPAEPRTDS
jgi:hypothetical protein